MRRRGFTLMEVVVAIAITAAMGAMIAVAFNSSMQSKQIVEQEAERYRSIETAMSRMTREIGAAFVSNHYDVTRFRDQNDRPTNFIGEKNRLIFSSFAHQRLYTDAKESDQMVVEYSVRSSTDRDAHGRNDLYRRENPILDGQLDKGGTEDVLLEDCQQVEFAYWDSDKKEWEDEWDTRRVERMNILPTRVRITLITHDELGKEVKYTTQTRIMLNTAIPAT